MQSSFRIVLLSGVIACGGSVVNGDTTSSAGTSSSTDGTATGTRGSSSMGDDTAVTSSSSNASSSSDEADTGEPIDDGCWPWVQPSTESLRASPRKVFAHYFSPYPISLDNRAPDNDYYTRHYLNPDGEDGKHASYGGLLRERPLPREPLPDGVMYEYELDDMRTEVRRAIAIGLDGLTFDVINPYTGQHYRRMNALLDAAQDVDPEFVIQLVPDMTASSFNDLDEDGDAEPEALDALRALLDAVGSHPSVQRLPDGRIVLSPFAATNRSGPFWTNALETLEAEGYPIALIPMPVGGWSAAAEELENVPLYGASSWGRRVVSAGESLKAYPAIAHAQGLIWMAPVAPQDSRPKNDRFTESNNSAAFRVQWNAAIEGGADWVQLITWNDYSENTQIAPSTRTHNAFWDLSAYYIAWFKLGAPPELARDGLYYFHRAHSMDPSVAPPDLTLQTAGVFEPFNGPETSSDEIEVVALLTTPASVEIEIAGEITVHAGHAGLNAFTLPLVEGRPVFRVVRDGSTLELESATTIDNTIVYQDPLYHAGSIPTCTPDG